MRQTLLSLFFLPILVFLNGMPVFPSGVNEELRKGNAAYAEEDFSLAETFYSQGLEKEQGYKLYFNRGAARYNQGGFADSINDFQDSAVFADSEEAQSDALFNAGNAGYRKGETAEAKDPAAALKSYQTAASFFERVLEIEPEHPKAPVNLELSRRKIRELEEKLRQSRNQPENQDQNRDGDREDTEQGSQNEAQEQEEREPEEQKVQEPKNQETQAQEQNDRKITPEDILRQEELQNQYRSVNNPSASGEVDKNW